MNWVKYQNGNYTVMIDLDNGTKVRKNDLDYFEPNTVESMDIKITNSCEGGRIVNGKIVPCEFCHEKSYPNGKHADILSSSFIDKLHPYTELAIGGGNPLEHPDLEAFLIKCKSLKLIPSMTVSQIHFMKEYGRIKKLIDEKLIYGLGISLVDSSNKEFIERVEIISNAVIHVINGVVTENELKDLADKNLKILILGYKTFGRGIENYNSHSGIIEENKNTLYTLLPRMIKENWFKVISFDNLAIEQLDPKRLMSEEKWSEFFMGEDGSATFYVDMVERKFALNSCSGIRYSLEDTAEEMFQVVRKEKGF